MVVLCQEDPGALVGGTAAKLGVLAASGGAAVPGLAPGRPLLTPTQAAKAQTADEAECSTET